MDQRRQRNLGRALRGLGQLPQATTLTLVCALLLVGGMGANSGPATLNVRDLGAVGDGIANDTAAFQLAEEMLAEQNGGVIFVPCGDYRLGETGPSRFITGLRIRHSNVTVRGEGNCSTLLPGFDHGGTVIIACSTARDNSCVDPEQISNIHFENFRIYDDDPIGHCQGSGLSCLTEETHGIILKGVSDVTVRNVTFDNLGDESLDIPSGTSDVLVENNHFTRCPSLRSEGACIEISGAQNVRVQDNVLEGGISSGKIIGIVTNAPGVETVGVVVTRNTLLERDPPPYTNWIPSAILIASNFADIRDVEISNNLIDHDIPRPGMPSIAFAGGSFERRGIRIVDNEIRGSIHLWAHDLEISGNDISGGFGPDGEECSGGSVDLDDPDRQGIAVGGTNLQVTDNTIRGHKRSCIWLIGGNDIDIGRNSCIGTSTGAPGDAGRHAVIDAFPSNRDEVSGLRVFDNLIEGHWSLGTDGVCTPNCAVYADKGVCDRYSGPGIFLEDIEGIEVVGNEIWNVGQTGIRSGGLIEQNVVVNAGLGCERASPRSDVGIAISHTDYGAPQTPGTAFGFEDAGENYNPAPKIRGNLISGTNEGCLEHDGSTCVSRESPLPCVALEGLAGPWEGVETTGNSFEGCGSAILSYRAFDDATRVGWSGAANVDSNSTLSIHELADFDVPGSVWDIDLHELGLETELVDRRSIEAAGMLPATSCVEPRRRHRRCGLGAELGLVLPALLALRHRRLT